MGVAIEPCLFAASMGCGAKHGQVKRGRFTSNGKITRHEAVDMNRGCEVPGRPEQFRNVFAPRRPKLRRAWAQDRLRSRGCGLARSGERWPTCMNTHPRILAFSGSARKESFNRKLLALAIE